MPRADDDGAQELLLAGDDGVEFDELPECACARNARARRSACRA